MNGVEAGKEKEEEENKTRTRHADGRKNSDTIENIAKVEPALADVPCEHILGLVIYDLPGRDCAAKAPTVS